MTLDLTKPVQTSDGRAVRVLCTNRSGGRYPIVALIMEYNGEETLTLYTANGVANGPSRHDLVNVPEETVEFVNYYAVGSSGAHPSKEIADSKLVAHRLALLKITFTIDGKVTKVDLVK